MPAPSRSPTQRGAPTNCQSRSPFQQCGRAGHEALSLLSPLPTIRLAPAPSWPTTAALQAALGIHFSLQHRLEGELQPTQALTLKPKDSSQSAALLILFHQNLQHFLLSYPPPSNAAGSTPPSLSWLSPQQPSRLDLCKLPCKARSKGDPALMAGTHCSAPSPLAHSVLHPGHPWSQDEAGSSSRCFRPVHICMESSSQGRRGETAVLGNGCLVTGTMSPWRCVTCRQG